METKNYDKEERFDPATVEALKLHYAEILRLLGEDPAREGLLKTPERVAKAMAFLTKGYDENPLDIIRSAMFREEYRQMVLVKDIELYSLCEHHMLPFYGKAHVAYIPNGYITGLSKVARVVECFARRLQVQERLTVQIRDCIQEALNPMGVAVVSRPATCHGRCAASRSAVASTTSASRRLPVEPADPRGVHDPHFPPLPLDLNPFRHRCRFLMPGSSVRAGTWFVSATARHSDSERRTVTGTTGLKKQQLRQLSCCFF